MFGKYERVIIIYYYLNTCTGCSEVYGPYRKADSTAEFHLPGRWLSGSAWPF